MKPDSQMIRLVV